MVLIGMRWYRLATVAILCLSTTPVMAAVTVLGDRGAYDELVGSFKKLFSLPGFRAKTTSGQGLLVIEFASPNSWHVTTQAQGYKMEQIVVAGRTAMRGNMPGMTPEWRCPPAHPSSKRFIDIVSQEEQKTGTISVSRGADTVIEGTPVHTVISTRNGEKTTVYVGSQTGLPRRVSGTEGRGGDIDYYDYGAPVTISLPACSQ